MTNKDKIKNIIIKSLETANEELIADAYYDTVSCDDCPYWHDCENEYDCNEYILNKLVAKSEDE